MVTATLAGPKMLQLSFILVAIILLVTVVFSGRGNLAFNPRTAAIQGNKTPLINTPLVINELHPSAKRVIFNIGSFNDPPAPIDNDTVVIAVEANADTSSNIPVMPNRYVLTAAISDTWGLAILNHYADSSSLLKPNRNHTNPNHNLWTEGWTTKGGKGRKVIVPTMPLYAVMKLAPNLECWFLKLDTQGLDFRIARSAGRELLRCPYISAETYCNGFQTYTGAQNDFDNDWLPYMIPLGFSPVNTCEPGHMDERNIIWKNKNVAGLPLEEVKRRCPLCVS